MFKLKCYFDTFSHMHPMQIVFEFSRGERYDGDIAIDDVIVTDYACPGNREYVMQPVS